MQTKCFTSEFSFAPLRLVFQHGPDVPHERLNPSASSLPPAVDISTRAESLLDSQRIRLNREKIVVANLEFGKEIIEALDKSTEKLASNAYVDNLLKLAQNGIRLYRASVRALTLEKGTNGDFIAALLVLDKGGYYANADVIEAMTIGRATKEYTDMLIKLRTNVFDYLSDFGTTAALIRALPDHTKLKE